MDAVEDARLRVVLQEGAIAPWRAWTHRDRRNFMGGGRDPQEALESLRRLLQERYPDEAWPWSRFMIVDAEEGGRGWMR